MERFFDKLADALSTACGRTLCASIAVSDFLAGYETTIGFTAAAVVADAFWGVCSSLKRGDFAKSELARESFSKLAVYGTVLLLFILIDKLTGAGGGLPLSVICVCMILVETWSATASMLICFPRMPILRLLRHALAGEIANKLGMRTEEALKALDALNGEEADKREEKGKEEQTA